MRDGPQEPDALHDLLRELTRLMLTFSGEGAEGVDRVVRNVARTYGGQAETVLVADGAVLSVTTGGHTLTSTVTAFPDVARLDRAVALKEFLERVRDTRPPLSEAAAGLRRVETLPATVPRWARGVGIVLFSVGFAPAVQPTWYEIGTTALLAALVALLTVLADRRPRLARVLPLLAAVLVSLVTLGLLQPGRGHGGPVLIMLPALFFFVPGDLLSAATAELVGGFLSTGAVRLVYALVLLLQLYVGVLLGVAVTGTPTDALFDTTQDGDLSRWVIVGSWAVFTLGLILAFGVPWRVAGWVTGLVYLALGVQAAGTALLGEVAGTFVAATALAVAADLLSRPAGRPPRLVLFLGGFFTLTVGSLGLRALTSLAGGHVLHGFHDLMDFVTIVTTIAVGLLAGAALVPARGLRT
ncbi:threonine/serine exporter family protein [Streptomyces sp. NRRL B-24572]|uniref:threonine/serine exporter family protein n=1 Tax=Streptomyces sp. NRRL B-24572 TaxID=1962156 RepID=UPI000A3A534D|nr:threonine/serine exporter family protein [Streptomyces sp. NRRL B-24572]